MLPARDAPTLGVVARRVREECARVVPSRAVHLRRERIAVAVHRLAVPERQSALHVPHGLHGAAGRRLEDHLTLHVPAAEVEPLLARLPRRRTEDELPHGGDGILEVPVHVRAARARHDASRPARPARREREEVGQPRRELHRLRLAALALAARADHAERHLEQRLRGGNRHRDGQDQQETKLIFHAGIVANPLRPHNWPSGGGLTRKTDGDGTPSLPPQPMGRGSVRRCFALDARRGGRSGRGCASTRRVPPAGRRGRCRRRAGPSPPCAPVPSSRCSS